MPKPSPPRHWLLLLIVVAAAVLVRLPQLSLSVSGDEPFSLITADMSWADMNRELIADFVHPPLHYYVLHLWFRAIGFGIEEGRVVSVIFGVSAVIALYLLGAYLFGRAVGILSAVLLGISQMAVLYSQEARPYAMNLFLAILTSYFFVVAVRDHRRSYWWGFIASTVLMLYTLYYSVFLLLGILIFLFLLQFRWREKVPGSWLLQAAIVVVLAFLPWAASGVVQQALHDPKIRLGNEVAFRTHWYTPIVTLNRFNNGAVSDAGLDGSSPLWTYPVGVVLFSIAALASLRRMIWNRAPSVSAESTESQGILFAVLLCGLPIVAVTALGILHIQFKSRYLLFCAPFYYLLVARGICLIRSVALRSLVVAPLLVYSAYAIQHSYAHPFNEDSAGALSFVSAALEPDDCAIFAPENKLSLQWRNDRPGQQPLRVLNLGTGRLSLDSIPIEAPGCRRTWAVVTTAFGNRPRDVLAARLSKNQVLLKEQKFRKVHVLLYEPSKL